MSFVLLSHGLFLKNALKKTLPMAFSLSALLYGSASATELIPSTTLAMPLVENTTHLKPLSARTSSPKNSALFPALVSPSSANRQYVSFREKRRSYLKNLNQTAPASTVPAMDPETEALLTEIRHLPWGLTPDHAEDSPNIRHIGLDKVFHEALDHSINIRQAEAKLEDPPGQGSSAAREANANMLNWILPTNTSALKEASRLSTEASRAHVQVIRQKTLLESAKLYAALCKAYLERYLASQSMDQALRQLTTEEKRFQAGETDRFDVTRMQMAIIDRYSHYLTSDNSYKGISVALSGMLGYTQQLMQNVTWIPEDFSWKDGEPGVPALNLFPEDLSLEAVRRAAQLRPDLREATLQIEAMERLVKIAFGPDKEKRKAELKQMELERDKGTQAANVALERAFNDFKLSQKTVDLAQKQAILAKRFVDQLQVSYQAGFTSAREVLDGQADLLKAQTALLAARVSTNQSRIQLLFEMGQLSERSLSHPLNEVL
jgi:outer membrane protein TolC